VTSRVSRWLELGAPKNSHRVSECLGWRASGLPLLAAAMDAAWIAPYSLMLGTAWMRPGAFLLAPLTVWALLALAQTVTRAVLARSVPVARARLLLTTAGAAAALVAVAAQYNGDPWWRTHGPLWHAADLAVSRLRPELPAFVLGVLAWRRGIGIGRSTLEYYDVEGIFYLGLAMLGLFAAGTALGHAEPIIAVTVGGALPYLVAFFAASLIALPVARLRSVRQRTQASPQAVTVGRDWYGLIGGAVAAVLGVAFLAAAVLRLNLAAAIVAASRLLEPLLWAMLYVVAVPLGFIVSGLIRVVQRLVHPHAAPQPLRAFAPPPWLAGGPQQGSAALSPGAAAALRWGVTAFIVVLILLWLARAVFRYDHIGKALPVEETHESVWSWADLKAAFAAWLGRRHGRRAGRAGAHDFGLGATAVVRRAYADLLGFAAAAGAPRVESQTPAEFANRLGAAWPEANQEVQRLTAVYNRVRYGTVAPSDADLATVSDALAKIHGTVDTSEGGQPDA
jgi:hypothetical protein